MTSEEKQLQCSFSHQFPNSINGCEYLICFSSVPLPCLSPLHAGFFFFCFVTTPSCLPFLLYALIWPDVCVHSLTCHCSSGIGTMDGSARKDEDFKGKSQRQVQFNPGQTMATWRVQILTDGKYEQVETFQILLMEPVMAVMEFPSTATVEILDPSDGQYCSRTHSPALSMLSVRTSQWQEVNISTYTQVLTNLRHLYLITFKLFSIYTSHILDESTELFTPQLLSDSFY